MRMFTHFQANFSGGRKLLSLSLLALAAGAGRAQEPPRAAPGNSASVDAAKGQVTIMLNGTLFTQLKYSGFAKPILYPVMTEGGLNLVRRWPVESAGPGEEQDHPHHKGIWFTHGDVNGVDFWKEAPDAGRILVEGIPTVENQNDTVSVTTNENWMAPGDKKICDSKTVIRCGTEGHDRWLDYTITINADAGEVVFGDTKEGTMGLRSHPALNLKGEVAKGRAVNSEGEKNAALWGRPAKWVDYSAPVDGKMAGIACFDHPSNLRHPTTWHARDYGLIAANPFGLHDFTKQPKGAGNHTIKAGQSLTLRYRWLFHAGDSTEAKIEQRWAAWAAAPVAR